MQFLSHVRASLSKTLSFAWLSEEDPEWSIVWQLHHCRLLILLCYSVCMQLRRSAWALPPDHVVWLWTTEEERLSITKKWSHVPVCIIALMQRRIGHMSDHAQLIDDKFNTGIAKMMSRDLKRCLKTVQAMELIRNTPIPWVSCAGF